MHKKNAEIFHSGWLTKSPPTKRIWRARWRRRWFTLKQGELPGQFFLEYYTDRNCRKLKGIIDLDQVEQVDAGLQLDRQKIKYAHMFDVKTPNRTYYLAADSEEDMREWVLVICQVCNLQETEEKNGESSVVQYLNIGPNGDVLNDEVSNITGRVDNSSGFTETTLLTNSVATTSSRFENMSMNMTNDYENDQVTSYRHSNYTNRETLHFQQNESQSNNNQEPGLNYSNLPGPIVERSHSLRQNNNTMYGSSQDALQAMHHRTQSLVEQMPRTAGAIKKIPDRLKLRSSNDDKINNNTELISPAPSSGPYIPISECFSGSPVIFNNENPTTPLNSLDPRFYDTPRSHNNIGLNLTSDQPYSPKRNNNNNYSQHKLTKTDEMPSKSGTIKKQSNQQGSGQSTPTDSESVFTDDEWVMPISAANTIERTTRPSDSSIENDAIAFTYVQRFSKSTMHSAGPPLPPKRISLVLDNKMDSPSDTEENASPAQLQGPQECTAFVEENYDIPRSHQQHSNRRDNGDNISVSSLNIPQLVSSTPNLIPTQQSQTLDRPNRSNFYTNAAPSKQGNVFRYDFFDDTPAPVVNRRLKPKSNDSGSNFDGYGTIKAFVPPVPVATPSATGISAPTVDRKLKPGTPKPVLPSATNSLRRRGPASISLSEVDDNFQSFLDDSMLSNQSFGISPKTPNSKALADDRLQYLDLDHTSSPQKVSISSIPSTSVSSNIASLDNSLTSAASLAGGSKDKDGPGVAYTTVDFLKTDAFNRVREDSELTRASKSRMKN